MSHFICPVCQSKLFINENGKSVNCENKHSFDIAKSGYVNLLMSQQRKVKRHGDDKLMVHARRDFLDKGFYMPLLELISRTLASYARDSWTILDAGCGECWYTASIYDELARCNLKPELFAVDISKEALAIGARRNRNIELAVASVFSLPVQEASCDAVLSVFAPLSTQEFHRVLKTDGILLRVIPLEKHLLSLKAAVYDRVYENKAEKLNLNGFDLVEKQELRGMIHLASNQDILNVFAMTPYYYKTGAEDQAKLGKLDELETEIEFGVLTYRKRSL